MSGRRLSDDERRLWSGVTRSIAPLRRRAARPEAAPAEPTPGASRQPPAVPKARPLPVTAPAPAPRPAPVPPLATLGRRFRQEVARGRRPIDGRLDLHGMTQGEAHGALLSFLRATQARGGRLVLVITGKGTAGDEYLSERGVLRRQVPRWLRLPEFRQYVVGFESAGIGHGGEGALYVSLRRTRAPQE
jgi:DNA-nicking Smr family endonuclease